MGNFWRTLGAIATGGVSNLVEAAVKKSKGTIKTSNDIRNDVAQEHYIQNIREMGYDPDEYFRANPAKLKEYEDIAKRKKPSLVDRVKDSVKGVIDDVRSDPDVDAYIKNITGQKDIAENEKNRQFQSEEAEKNRVWEEEQAKAAREWDSIGSQMERAAAVGVNPISVAMQNGGIGASATTSIPAAPSTPSGSASLTNGGLPDLFSTIMNGIGVTAEMRLKQSQSDDIVAMRKYNIAEKIANTDHLRSLCEGQGLSNVAQQIQNNWLDVMNQATYDGMLLENGVKRSTILEKSSVARLNLKQIASIHQQMEMDLKAFNAKLPLELQLMEEDINLKKMSSKELYEEIALRHLQAIEQESRNRQAASEAESADVAASIAKQTMEDAIADFHNSMVHHAAEAGIRLNDYMYYGASPINAWDMPSVIMNLWNKGKSNVMNGSLFDQNLRGLGFENKLNPK